MDPVFLSVVFMLVNVICMWAILILSRRVYTKPVGQKEPAIAVSVKKELKASEILGWEFDYARTTASEAMQDRHTMMNFYLVVVAVVASGVTAVVTQKAGDSSLTIGTLLLWVLCEVGWLYYLKILKLREAWYESALAMNQIKECYFQHVNDFDGEALRSAFRWQVHTTPALDKPWTVFFYSAMLIGFLDSVAFVGGGFLIDSKASLTYYNLGALTVLGVLFFLLHVYLYFAFLESKP